MCRVSSVCGCVCTGCHMCAGVCVCTTGHMCVCSGCHMSRCQHMSRLTHVCRHVGTRCDVCVHTGCHVCAGMCAEVLVCAPAGTCVWHTCASVCAPSCVCRCQHVHRVLCVCTPHVMCADAGVHTGCHVSVQMYAHRVSSVCRSWCVHQLSHVCR